MRIPYCKKHTDNSGNKRDHADRSSFLYHQKQRTHAVHTPPTYLSSFEKNSLLVLSAYAHHKNCLDEKTAVSYTHKTASADLHSLHILKAVRSPYHKCVPWHHMPMHRADRHAHYTNQTKAHLIGFGFQLLQYIPHFMNRQIIQGFIPA